MAARRSYFLYAAGLLSYAIGASFAFNVCMAMRDFAVSGTLDEALIRPVSTFPYLIATHYNLGYIAHIIITVIALAVSIAQLGIASTWTFLYWLWFVVLILAGAVINGCMMLLLEFPALRTRSRSPANILFWGFWGVKIYPITIFPRSIQLIFTVALPYAFINFYPMQVLLGKRDGLFMPYTLWLSPVVAVVLLGLTALCWRIASGKYESAGT